MNFPEELQYSESHEWVEFTSDTTATIGITAFAQDSLGDIVFVDLPEAGDLVELSEDFGDVESVKAVSELISPLSGEVYEVNEALLDEPELINEDPYENWLIKVINITATEQLMDAEDYKTFCEQEG